MYYKGIVRDTNFGRFTLPDVDELEISINSYFFIGDESFSDTFDVSLDEDGVFTGELVLPEDMALGDYSFNITGDYWLSTRTFTVAEYRTPEFEVTATPEQAELMRGQATSVEVNATYLFGGSAAGLPVDWNVFETEYIPQFDLNPPYVFGDQGQINYGGWCLRE